MTPSQLLVSALRRLCDAAEAYTNAVEGGPDNATMRATEDALQRAALDYAEVAALVDKGGPFRLAPDVADRLRGEVSS